MNVWSFLSSPSGATEVNCWWQKGFALRIVGEFNNISWCVGYEKQFRVTIHFVDDDNLKLDRKNVPQSPVNPLSENTNWGVTHFCLPAHLTHITSQLRHVSQPIRWLGLHRADGVFEVGDINTNGGDSTSGSPMLHGKLVVVEGRSKPPPSEYVVSYGFVMYGFNIKWFKKILTNSKMMKMGLVPTHTDVAALTLFLLICIYDYYLW